jgi:hypothetical protein
MKIIKISLIIIVLFLTNSYGYANVKVNKHLDMNVGGNLIVKSLQDTKKSSTVTLDAGTSSGISAGSFDPYTTNRGRELNEQGSGKRNSLHPDHPLDRPNFNKDRNAYWIDRLNNMGGN